MSLPTSRHFVTQLLSSLSSSSSQSSHAAQNPLSAVPEPAKKQLLSLQILFPNEFLPALDLLDRGLVTRLSIHQNTADDADDDDEPQRHDRSASQHATTTRTNQPPPEPTDDREGDTIMIDHATAMLSSPGLSPCFQNCIYYVRSAQQRSSRYTSYDMTSSYEVRLVAWNCSCPAFAFAAFPAVQHPEPAIPTCDAAKETQDSQWSFGGVSLGESMSPVCKHLLACVLAERCAGLFGNFVEEKVVGLEEAAGWAAGWGD
ncbi:hypothetical protein ACEQ8H_000542 [Pleosporales sp. CAS-2024a]